MFADREDAGRQLARRLQLFRDEDPIVLALPRGGVPVGFEVARALGAPLDVWVVRKVGAPGFEELGLGAVAEGGVTFIDRETVWEVGASDRDVERTIARKRAEVEERAARFREGRPPPAVAGRTVILVDDGIATGGTVRAAVDAIRARGPRRIVLAVPVAATQSLAALQDRVDELICLLPTPALYAIGAWYEDFGQVSDDEVVRLLSESRAAPAAPAPLAAGAPADHA